MAKIPVRFIKDLISEMRLKPEATIYLESLAFQMQEAGNDSRKLREDLVHAVEIASRYSDHISALKVLDQALESYFNLEKQLPHGRLGSLKNLNREELYLGHTGIKLVLNGLESRVEDYLLARSEAQRGGDQENESSVDEEDLQKMKTYRLTPRNTLK